MLSFAAAVLEIEVVAERGELKEMMGTARWWQAAILRWGKSNHNLAF